jgi:oligopeptide/dipeptide ABC transporter ATP-binding protein
VTHNLGIVAKMCDTVAVMYRGKIVEVADSLDLCDKPLHPYTKALFAASLPSHPDEERDEIVLSGEVLSALNPPSGCHFHPRCPFAMARCSGQEPKLVEVSAGHQVACYLY